MVHFRPIGDRPSEDTKQRRGARSPYLAAGQHVQRLRGGSLSVVRITQVHEDLVGVDQPPGHERHLAERHLYVQRM